MISLILLTAWVAGFPSESIAHGPLQSICKNDVMAASLTKSMSREGNDRYESLQELTIKLKNSKCKKFSQEFISALGISLRSADPSVRFWSAMMLGNIGPNARSALPTLRKAAVVNAHEHGSITSVSAIKRAIILIEQ